MLDEEPLPQKDAINYIVDNVRELGGAYSATVMGDVVAIQNGSDELCIAVVSELAVNFRNDSEEQQRDLVLTHRATINAILRNYHEANTVAIAFVLPNSDSNKKNSCIPGIHFVCGFDALSVFHLRCIAMLAVAKEAGRENTISGIKKILSTDSGAANPRDGNRPDIETVGVQTAPSPPSVSASTDGPPLNSDAGVAIADSAEAGVQEENPAPPARPTAEDKIAESKPAPASAFLSLETDADVDSDSVSNLEVIKRIVELLIRNKSIVLTDVELGLDDVCDEDALLPALLAAAAIEWSPVVLKKGGVGGFCVFLGEDENGLTGYRVLGVKASSPSVLAVSVSHMLQIFSTEVHGRRIIHMEWAVRKFEAWLKANGLNARGARELQSRVVLT